MSDDPLDAETLRAAAEQVTLDPDVKAKADAVVAERPITKLVYAEDLAAGHILVVDRDCDGSPLTDLLGGPHDHGVEQRIVLEVRESGGIVSAITVDEEGQQQPYLAPGITLVRVVST